VATSAASAQVASLKAPPLANFDRLLQSSGEREISTTMAFVQMLGTLVRDKTIGKHIVPIVPDESRTFGMEGMFRQLGIYSSVGQLYKPQDADQLMYYREDKSGQVLQEGINEAGAMSSWIAASTSYSTNNVPMIPFLHLLLDVRPATGRRPRMACRRHARARLPARRHGGAHDLER
jgi:pyruvate dehydrogenase E1 component